MRTLRLLVCATALLLTACTESPIPDSASAAGYRPTENAAPPVRDTAPDVTPDVTAGPASGQSAADQGDAPDADRPTSGVAVEPAVLEVGQVRTHERGYGEVELVNYGTEPVTVTMCKSTCGCAAASCPKDKAIAPGARRPVPIRVNADARPVRIEKEITFGFDGAPPVKLLVKAETVSMVVAEPWDLVPGAPVVLRSTDGQPFRVSRVSNDLALELSPEPAVQHVLMLDWDKWRKSGAGRKVVFMLDHPDCPQVLALVEAPPAE